MARISSCRLVFIAVIVAASFAAPLCLADTKASGPVTIIDMPREPGTFESNLPKIPGEASFTRPWDINDHGQIVGQYLTEFPGVGMASNAFLYSDGKFTVLAGPKGATYVAAFGINNKGEIVGVYRGKDRIPRGFLLKNGAFTLLPTPPGAKEGFSVNGINDAGEIIGSYIKSSANGNLYPAEAHGFLFKNGVYHTISVKGTDDDNGTCNWPSGINDKGDIVGTFLDQDGFWLGYLLRNGKYQVIRASKDPSTKTELLRINDQDQILGCSSEYNLPPTSEFVPMMFSGSFLLHGGVFTPIAAPPGATMMDTGERMNDALGLNNEGQVVGYFNYGPGHAHGYRMDTK